MALEPSIVLLRLLFIASAESCFWPRRYKIASAESCFWPLRYLLLAYVASLKPQRLAQTRLEGFIDNSVCGGQV